MPFQHTGPGVPSSAEASSSSGPKLVSHKRRSRLWKVWIGMLCAFVLSSVALGLTAPQWIWLLTGPVPPPVVVSPFPTSPPVVIKETEFVTVEVEVERVIGVPVERVIPVEVRPITSVVEPATSPMEVPTLMLPVGGSTTRNPVRFEWEGRLRPGQTYRVTAYQVGGEGSEQSPYLTATGWEVTFVGEAYGSWQWVVAIMLGESTVAISDVGQFWFDPFADSVGGGE